MVAGLSNVNLCWRSLLVQTNDRSRRLIAEALGTMILVCAVVGSGIMADRLSGDDAITLLANTISTGAILLVLISVLGPISGAHLNPAVTIAFALRQDISGPMAVAYCVAQIGGGISGTFMAHAMFEMPLLQLSETMRIGQGQWLAEVVATFGLVAVIFGALRIKPNSVPQLVALYITAAYWFTSSTSFANPAVTIARSLTDTFSGIRPIDVPSFIVAEIAGALLAMVVCRWLYAARNTA